MIFTFYSYKGGVGRSMAMAGVAHLLAQRGLRVLAVDFDLEAPGLERYFFDGERCRAVRELPGLIDLVRAYRNALASEESFRAGDFKRWQDFRLTAIHTAGPGGSVDLMTSGRREPDSAMREYALTVRSFDWQDFFDNWKGDLFFDWLRRQLTAPQTGYDVVLVDSRTGVTEMGGVCAYQLADAAVLLSAPNYQNLEGTRDVARDFRSEAVRALRRGRPLEILAVPARLADEHPQRAEFLARFAETMGIEGLPAVLAAEGLDYTALALPYLPQFAIAERLVGDPAAGGDGTPPPIEIFERLADALTLLAPASTKLAQHQDAARHRLRGEAAEPAPTLLADTTRNSAGYDAFVDHSASDDALAVELVATLEAGGCRAVAEAAAPEPPTKGAPRPQAHALDYSQALLVCFGRPASAEGRARLIARARRLHDVAIVPVLLPGADPQALTSFDLAPDDALDLQDWPSPAAQRRLQDRVRAIGRRGGEAIASAVGDERPPYPGAASYAEDDAAWFCGREAEVDLLLGALAEHQVVELSGPAQCGKSSLVMAGLLPLLRQSRDSGLPRLMAMTVMDFGVEAPLPDPVATYSPTSNGLQLLIVESADSQAAASPAAAADDAVPEAKARERGRVAAIEAAIQAAQRAGHMKVLVLSRDVWSPAVREDWHRVLSAHAGTRIALNPLGGAALRRAIEEPARRAGHLLEPGLAERLIESAGGGGSAVAQIQLALAAIWPRRARGWLTNSALDAVGHLDGVVGARRRALLAKLPPAQQAAATTLFTRLMMLSRFDKLVATPQPWAALATIPQLVAADAPVLRDRLAGAGVIDLYRAEGTEGHDVDEAVQVALARPDPAVYFDDGAAGVDLRLLLWLATLRPLVRQWRLRGGHDLLLRGSALAEGLQWRDVNGALLTARERDFIDESAATEARRADAVLKAHKAQERERLEAAEALAVEQEARARVESEAAVLARKDAASLRRGRRWLLGMLVATGLSALVGYWQTLNERDARQLAQQSERAAAAAREEAQADAQRARAEKQSADTAAASLEESLRTQRALLASAHEARQAAERALAARNADERAAAKLDLRAAGDKFRTATAQASSAQHDCPFGRRLYLHIGNEAERAAARGVIPLLEKQGFIVPGIKLVAGVPRSSELRYFRDDDAEVRGAEAAARALGAALTRPVPARLMSDMDTSGLRPCHYEAWFAPGTLARTEAGK